ncbi:SusD/RagB family nutrient-binding outer membrane lipoprotein [Paracnuella aquatica]|uniref:SusD/RagB family nutrient-binding outer membrane lipoprotein n=1 Tax=Paracnuella aquatica TaxID=2268757 RepID=UPI000DEEEC00|nr:SusD/RagB family nutrient-binding outer membrane lipoprotein [Paracnuella aquatica]RPD50551.1 SusD/RagB family nutrient-binding outer membrane lipoprotein [Paracnuella aquatica]
MNFKKYLIIGLLPFAITVTGCNKLDDFGDTNQNPNGASSPVVGALLTNVQAGYLGNLAANTRGGLYAQYFSETQYTDVSLYSLPQLNFSGEYAGPNPDGTGYSGPSLMDLQSIINANESNNQTQVARILQQYIYWTLTDRWGDIPYSEALKGNTTPKYDTQEEVYKGMIATLTDAVAKMDNASPITGDLVYSGNVSAWKKAANSMRMMMALQLSKRYRGANEYAATEFKAALNDPAGSIDENSENMTLRYPGGNFRNPWFNTYNGRKDFAQSKTLTDLTGALNDPRQQAFGGKSEDPLSPDYRATSNVGVPYGLARASAEAFTGANPTWARILRSDFRLENSMQVIISAADVTLARAEAADYGWTTENLANVYRRGIELSFEQWGLTAPATYFTQSNVALNAAAGTGANLRPIATQRYLAAYPNGLAAWNIWRKTGFPVLTPAPDATNSSKQIPRRYTYGPTEYGTNKAATDAAAARIQGGDTQDARVWWDVQ